MIKGHGSLITEIAEDGGDLPFLSTQQILDQLMKFGFYVTYDVKNNLPQETFNFLAQVLDLGFDKITRVALETIDDCGIKVWRPTILVMKSEYNTDLLNFDCKLARKAFNQKLTDNVLMNVTHTDNIQWDWVIYIANISDILKENLGEVPVPPNVDTSGFTEYDSEVVNDGE